jgi:CheY-like chemotaxis protein
MCRAGATFVTLRSQCPRERQPQGSPAVKVPFEIGKEMPDQILVLVAEDEELVRLVIVAALEDAGFEVIEAEHAEAAWSVLQINAASIRVLFTDIQMPGTMDGLALAHHTAKNCPKSHYCLPRRVPARISGASPRNAGF